ncbi:Ecdysteroid-phosphate phosphatase [Trichinella spiralis]|uniref:Ecdysteroid-phosphate phosphatase n=1 Tax=Trichinella spiralis TaxID=6334 RepID=A0ABR3K8X7_TRISP
MWFVFVKEVDLPPRYAEKVGKKPHGSSGPIMTGIESTSVTMGMEMTDVPYNVTNVISAPNFKCLTAAAAFINGYQGPVKVGQNALNIKIDGGLSLTNAAFEKHEKFQSLVAESGYNIDKTYKTVAEFSAESSLETRLEVTLESLRKTFPGTWQDAVAIFVEKSLHSILEIVTINDPVPLETYAVIGRPASVEDDDDDDDDDE